MKLSHALHSYCTFKLAFKFLLFGVSLAVFYLLVDELFGHEISLDRFVIFVSCQPPTTWENVRVRSTSIALQTSYLYSIEMPTSAHAFVVMTYANLSYFANIFELSWMKGSNHY